MLECHIQFVLFICGTRSDLIFIFSSFLLFLFVMAEDGDSAVSQEISESTNSSQFVFDVNAGNRPDSAPLSEAGDSDDFVSQESTHIGALRFELIAGARVDSALLYTVDEQQLYRKNSKYKSAGYWYKCRIAECTARVFLDSAEENCTRKKTKNAQHTHSNNQKLNYDELKVGQKIKSKCEALSAMDSSTQISAIFNRNVRE